MQHLAADRHFPDFEPCVTGGLEPERLGRHHHLFSIEVIGADAFHDHHSVGVILIDALNHQIDFRS